MANKCTKSVMKVVVLLIKPIVFLMFSLPLCCWILKTLLSKKNSYRLQFKCHNVYD